LDNATLSQNVVDTGAAGLKMASSLFLILALLLLGFYLVRRFWPRLGAGSSSQALQVVARQSIGVKKEIVVVRFLNRVFLLGVTESSITMLGEDSADHATQHQNFGAVLQAHGQGHGSSGSSAADPGSGPSR
jgi:flagellar protein FliO/FliZ